MTFDPKIALQDQYAPQNICFGCGPSNPQGLRIKSFVENDKVICRWTPEPHHQAFPGVLNGGIIGSLLDCHCNWTATWNLMQAQKLDRPPCTVTADYKIELKRPTPTDQELRLIAWPITIQGDRAVIKGELYFGEKLGASCEGTFVAVKEGHPAFHRW